MCGSRSPARPARCESRWRTRTPSLPAAANSGQYAATGASRSSSPRSASRCAHSAVGPLVVDHTFTRVSRSHGRLRAASAQPPHRSTTVRPSSMTVTAAPSSPRSRKFSSNAARTAANRSSQWPSMRMSAVAFDTDGALGHRFLRRRDLPRTYRLVGQSGKTAYRSGAHRGLRLAQLILLRAADGKGPPPPWTSAGPPAARPPGIGVPRSGEAAPGDHPGTCARQSRSHP